MKGLISISKSMLVNGVWNGPYEGADTLVTVLSDVDQIIFPRGLDVKCLIAPSCPDIYIGSDSRIRHIRVSGNVYSYGNIFFADIDAGGDLVAEGNIFSWISGITMRNGNIYTRGTIRAAGPIHALNGVVIADKGVEGEIRAIDIRALDVMIPGRQAPMALSQRKRIEARLAQGRKMIDSLTV